MLTVPEARRRGAARSILVALGAWGLERGALAAYLQVERDNAPARALYANAGFVPAYEYHYRTKFQPPGAPT
jgi:GNAT superfamily N-acetyltransferase